MSSSLRLLPVSLLLLILQFQLISGRVFERCELAGLLQHKFGLPTAQVATLVCIAQHSSDLNTAAYGGGSGPGGGSHGIFQISDVYWCSPPGQGTGCGISCARLRDDDITDDVLCVRKIFAEHQRIFGDGFTAWQAYNGYCRKDTAAYVASCGLSGGHHNAFQVAASYLQPQQVQVGYQQPQPAQNSYHQELRPQGKIYSRCELAQELYYQHKLPMPQIPTWVCIAQHESSYNTAAVGRLNADGSADHGLFQISDLFWCTHDQRGGKGCHASCNQFLDSSIADDVQCIRKIHQEHTQISGDGFTAWTVYNRDCRNQRYDHVAACFAKPQLVTPTTHPNAIGHAVGKVSYAYQFGQPTTPNPYYRTSNKLVTYQSVQATSSYQSNPFLRHRQPTPQAQSHPNAIGYSQKSYQVSPVNPLLNYKHHTTPKQNHQEQQYYQHYQQQNYYTTPKRAGKVYTRCELAQELYFSHKFPMQDLATWVCIAEHESRLDTAAVGRLNTDGSEDHGLFQISDLYWCTHGGGVGGKGCHIDCRNLLDSDIADDVKCIRTIHEEHTRISGDGFTAWTVYDGHCRNRSTQEIAICFEPSELKNNPVKPDKLIPTDVHLSKPKGKIYNRCELAQELFHKHKLPMREIPTWVCIAEHESSFNTAAVGRLNADGSADHGLFQISDLFWCTHNEGGGKACHIECSRLLDADITDDVKCIRTIHEEHTRISGDGFNAWTVYNGHCRHQSLAHLSDCFTGNEIAEAEKPNYEEQSQIQKQQQTVSKTSATLHQFSQVPAKPSTYIIAVPNHPFNSNPFLQQFLPHQHKVHPEKIIESTVSNPVTQSHHSQAYKTNPFLNIPSNIVSGINRPKISTNSTATTARPTKDTLHPYVNSDSFRHEIIKLTTISTTHQTTTTRPITRPSSTTSAANRSNATTSTTGSTATSPPRQTTPRPTSPLTTTTRTAHRTTTSNTRQTKKPATRPTTTTTSRSANRSNTLTSTTRSTAKTPTRQTTPRPTSPLTTTTRATHRTTTSTTRQTMSPTMTPTRQTTLRPTSRLTTTTRATHRATTRTTIHPTTTRTTARPITTATTRSANRSTATTYNTRSTATTSTRPTTPRPTTIRATHWTTTRTTIRPTTTRATARPTTIPTTRSTNRYTATTSPTRSTATTSTRPTTTRPSSRLTTTIRATHRTTTRTTTRPKTTRLPNRPTTSTRSPTSPRVTTPYPITTNAAHPNVRPSTSYKTTARPLSLSTSTTPRPYLFTSITTKTTTTHRPVTTVRSGSSADPFSHPFFARFNAKFEKNRTQTSTTTKPTSKALSNESTFIASPYYAKFQDNSVRVAAKTVFTYDFGQNRTTTTIRPYKKNFS